MVLDVRVGQKTSRPKWAAGGVKNEAELNLLVLYWNCDFGCELYRVGECDFGDFSNEVRML